MRRDHAKQASNEWGMTLVELMITVSIVAVLTTVATVAYNKHVRNGRVVDAYQLIGHIQAQQEAFFQANGAFCNASSGSSCTTAGGPTWHPTLATGMKVQDWDPASATLPGWNELNVQVPGNRTYFSFVAVAGVASNSYALRGSASTLGLTAGRPWYYIEARADMKADGSPYTEMNVTNLRSQIITRNKGE